MGNFDKTKPAGTTKLRLSDDQIRDNWDAIEDALVRMGTKFPAGYGVDAGELLVPIFQKQVADPDTPAADKLKLYAKTVGSQPRLYIKDPGGIVNPLAIPSGTMMLFYQDTAPEGWTIQDTLDDKLAYITKGSAAGGQVGGGVHNSGSWTISGLTTPDGVITGSHTLTIDEIPSHTHIYYTTSGAVKAGALAGNVQLANPITSEPTGGGGGHAHGLYVDPIPSDATWRPAAYCCIICEKD